jgi:hypothetical protein
MNPNIINKKKNLFSLTKEESIVRGTNKRERMIGLILDEIYLPIAA